MFFAVFQKNGQKTRPGKRPKIKPATNRSEFSGTPFVWRCLTFGFSWIYDFRRSKCRCCCLLSGNDQNDVRAERSHTLTEEIWEKTERFLPSFFSGNSSRSLKTALSCLFLPDQPNPPCARATSWTAAASRLAKEGRLGSSGRFINT